MAYETTLTPEDVKKLLTEFMTRERQTYVGMRYVPKFADPIEWDSNTEYEPLTMVTYNDAIYVSKFYVPVGVQITDTDYWIIWGTSDGGIIKPEMIEDNSITNAKLVQTGGVLEQAETLSSIITDNLMGVDVQKNLYEGAADFSGTWESNSPTHVVRSDETLNGYAVMKADGSWRKYYKFIEVEAGKSYTFEAWVKAANASNILMYFNDVGTATPSVASKQFTNVQNNTWTKISGTYNCTQSGTINPYVVSGNSTDLYIAHFVLVEGTTVFSLAALSDAVKALQQVTPIKNAGSVYGVSQMTNLNDAGPNTIYTFNLAGSTTTLPANYPTDTVITGFCMLATVNVYGTSSNVQYFYSVSSQKLYTRWSYNSGQTWTTWTLVKPDGAAGAYYTCMKDGSGDFNSLVTALNTLASESNATLYIGPGTWDVINELGNEYVESVSSSQRGLYLQNGIHVVCSSKAKITCNYTGTNASTREWLSLFNAGAGGFTLENAVLESSNIRYTVHDERGENTDHYENVYLNCKMTHNNGFYEQVIGGGLGIDGHVRILNCMFDSNKSNAGYLVSYHNSADGAYNPSVQTPKQARSNVEIGGNYFTRGSINIIKMGMSEEVSTVLIHDNSLAGAVLVSQSSTLYHYDNMEVLQWNNEVRS